MVCKAAAEGALVRGEKQVRRAREEIALSGTPNIMTMLLALIVPLLGLAGA